MATAKDIRVYPCDKGTARAFIAKHHYSGKNASAQWLYLAVALQGEMIGAISVGRPIDPRKSRLLVKDTAWDSFCEIGRMVMIDDTPRNVESRALAVACRLIHRQYPYIEWIQTFADGTQCGDGTIYRAAAFLLTGIRKNLTILQAPTGERVADLTLKTNRRTESITRTKGKHALANRGAATLKPLFEAGYKRLPGFQLRYVKFLIPGQEHRLTVPVMPYSDIERLGAGMYKGRRKDSSEPPGDPARRGQGSTDPGAPQSGGD